MSKKIPKVIKDTFYLEWSKPNNYKDLVIKKNSVTKDLETIYNNNIWNLKEQSIELSKKIEYHGIYNAFINGVYLLDYKQKPQITSISKKIFIIINIKEITHKERNSTISMCIKVGLITYFQNIQKMII